MTSDRTEATPRAAGPKRERQICNEHGGYDKKQQDDHVRLQHFTATASGDALSRFGSLVRQQQFAIQGRQSAAASPHAQPSLGNPLGAAA